MLDESISIVTPTYNRIDAIFNSIDSSLAVVKSGLAHEVIVVDDASSDGTFDKLVQSYADEIERGEVVLERLDENVGVTGAKNRGVQLARCEWVAFMDSDDIFLATAAQNLRRELKRCKEYDLVFFRCSDICSGELIGPIVEPLELKLHDLLNKGTPGECLPIVRREVALKHPYHESLRGCESLAYYKMLSCGCRGYLSEKVVRGYESSGEDRLSTKSAILKRAPKMLRYNIHLLSYIKVATPKRVVGIIFRIIYYSFYGLVGK